MALLTMRRELFGLKCCYKFWTFILQSTLYPMLVYAITPLQFQTNLICIPLLIRESPSVIHVGLHITLIMEYYAQEITTSNLSVKTFLTLS
jgi:hypothetical protein